MTEALDGQVNLFDLGIWSGKMCPEHSAATSRMASEIEPFAIAVTKHHFGGNANDR